MLVRRRTGPCGRVRPVLRCPTLVIGRSGRGISKADAYSHICGYTIINDVTARDLQGKHKQWFLAKSLDTFCPMGPWLVTADEVPDPQALRMWLDVNGRRMQDGSTATMVYKVPFLIHYLSQFFTLHPGDVVSTGTPPGVGLGMKPPQYLKPGDVVELGIEGLGSQRQVCVADD